MKNVQLTYDICGDKFKVTNAQLICDICGKKIKVTKEDISFVKDYRRAFFTPTAEFAPSIDICDTCQKVIQSTIDQLAGVGVKR